MNSYFINISILQNTVYIVLKDITDGSDIPLLDCSFPSVIDKGRGYVLHACQQGIEQLPALRKVTVWQNAAALQRVSYISRYISVHY